MNLLFYPKIQINFFLYFVAMFFISISNGIALTDHELAEKFAPKIYFHSGEKYFPSSVEWYLERSQLVTIDKKAKKIGIGPLSVQTKKPKLNILAPKPLRPSQIAGKPQEYYIDPMNNKNTYVGMPLIGSKSPAPVYAAVFHNKATRTAAIQYWTFYPYNGPFQGLSLGGKDIVGFHEGDWEVLIVYVEETQPDKWDITRLYFGRHGREFGEPMDPKDPAMAWEGGHPVALAAKYGHGLYPASVSTRWTRKAADSVNKGSKYWNTWENVILISASTDWNTFKGRWGLAGVGPDGPSQKLLWERTQSGVGASKHSPKDRLTVLREYAVGTGDKRKLFNMSISSHYSTLCFTLKDKDGKDLKNTEFKIMERKRIGKNKEWYTVRPAQNCVKSRVVEHKEMKGAFINITKNIPLKSGEMKLVIEGVEPF